MRSSTEVTLRDAGRDSSWGPGGGARVTVSAVWPLSGHERGRTWAETDEITPGNRHPRRSGRHGSVDGARPPVAATLDAWGVTSHAQAGGWIEHQVSYTVYYEDTDCLGAVYYANYLKFMERGRSEFLRAHGKSVADWNKEGILIVVHALTMGVAPLE
jgi:hypothetical protein